MPAGVDHPHRHPGDVGGQPGQVGLGADRGERPPVDLGAVVLVVVHQSSSTPVAGGRSRRRRRPGPRGRPQRRSQPAQCWRAPPAGSVAGGDGGAGVGAHVGQRLRAARTAGAGGHPQPRAGLVEHQRRCGTGRRAASSTASVGQVGHDDAAPRGQLHLAGASRASRSAWSAVSRPSGTTPTSAVRPSTCATAPTGPRTGAGGTAGPADRSRRAGQPGGDPVRPVGQLGQPPGGRRPARRARRGRRGRRPARGRRRRRGGPQPAVDAAEQQRHGVGVEGQQADVPTEAGDVAAAVVQRGQEPAGQLGQVRVGAQPGVQGGDPRPDVERARRRSARTACWPARCGPARGWRWAAARRRPAASPARPPRPARSAAQLHVARGWSAPGAPSPSSRGGGGQHRSCPRVSVPPGTRTRASPPSAAACVCSAPGQASTRSRSARRRHGAGEATSRRGAVAVSPWQLGRAVEGHPDLAAVGRECTRAMAATRRRWSAVAPVLDDGQLGVAHGPLGGPLGRGGGAAGWCPARRVEPSLR